MTLRILIVVTHVLGAGHLTRAAAIAQAMAEAGHDVTLVSGGRPTAVLREGSFRLVQLPPVQARVADLGTLRDPNGQKAGPEYLQARRELLLRTLDAVRPDALLTELFPFGRRPLREEYLALVRAAREHRPRPLIACSIRDILAAPTKPERIAETHRILAELYDAAFVHGDPELVRLEASWPVGSGVGVPLVYTGYVDTEFPPVAAAESGEVVVSGGSSAGAMPLFRAALDAAHIVPERTWRILLGRGISPAEAAEVAALRPENAIAEPARPDFRELMAGSSAFVGQAGYNTVLDLFAARPRAVLVPFEEGDETEQRLRADLLAERGVAAVLPEAELSGPNLAAAVRSVLARPRPEALAVARDGARRTAEILADLAGRRSEASAVPLG
jgi:predicted glycosyltransferase